MSSSRMPSKKPVFPKKNGFTQFPDKYTIKYADTPAAGYYNPTNSLVKPRCRSPVLGPSSKSQERSNMQHAVR